MRAVSLLLTAFLLVGLSSCGQYGKERRRTDSSTSSERDQDGKPKPFQAGFQYDYIYNGQISSGLNTNGPEQPSTGEPQQKAVSRVQAQVKITFQSEGRASLRLQQIRVGQLNEEIQSPEQVQPMGMFEKKQVEESKRRQLELPCYFHYNQGLVQQITFHPEDSTWAKNIKRSVLNLIQLNLKQQQQQQQQQQQWGASQEQQDDSQEYSSQQQQQNAKTFTLPEITIEGDCQTTYTINKDTKWAVYQDEQQEGGENFNVTKSINFMQCKKIADVGFGYQNQQQLQPECVQCQQQWNQVVRQGQSQQQQQAQPNPCSQCDPKEVKEQKLSRSTVMRFVLLGKPEKPAIQRTELISQYVYKNLRADTSDYSSAMQTIVAAELVFRNCKPARDSQQERMGGQGQQTTLLYDNEWDVSEKLFYMYGDEQFRGNQSPFSGVPNKVEQAQQIVRKLTHAASDKTNGIEFDEVVKLQRLVELFRMCSVQELKQICNTDGQQQQQSMRSESEQQKVRQVLADALAIAATRNTIQVLAEQITQGEMRPAQAFQALKSLNGLPAPSDRQVDIIQKLCKNQAVHRSPALKQTCWLTFGSMVAELCQPQQQQQSQQRNGEQQQIFGAQTGFKQTQDKEQMCSQSKKQAYKQALVEQYEQAETTYEKVLALKALGNAAIDTAATTLEKIIVDQKEDRLVRKQAIDALRRLRTQMPRKIQRILLPILQNTREVPECRMAAFSMLMDTQPEQQILDQLTYTLIKERNPHVQSFVHSVMKTLSKSKVPAEQQMAKHLKNTLKITKVEVQNMRASRFYQVPIYSKEQKEGVFLNLVSAFNSHSNVPTHLSATLDTLLNEEYEKDSLKVSLTQRGMEQWYESLVQNFLQAAKQQRSTSGRSTRAQRSSRRTGDQEMQDIFSSLNIKRRQNSYRNQQEQEDSQEEQQQQQNTQQQSNQPFGMICVRIGDVDQAILPIDHQSLPQCLKQMLKKGRFSLSGLTERMGDIQHFRILSAMNLNEKSAKIPTSMGVPLRILQAAPVLTSIEGSIKVNVESSGANSPVGIKTQLNLHPSGCAAHIQKMESWMPIMATGVESTRAMEWNAPIQSEIQADRQQGIKLVVKVPQAPKTRLFGVHTLPATYTRDWDNKMKMLREPKLKAIHNVQLEQLQTEVDKVVGQHSFGMGFRVSGHCHWPAQPSDYRQVAQLLMATENHLHISFEPQEGTPKEIILRANAQLFQNTNSEGGISHGPELDNFYSKDRKFEKAHPEDDFEDMELDGHDQRRQKLNSFLGKFQPGAMYQHSMHLAVETRGGRKECKARMDVKKTCDAKFRFCKMFVDVERTPILAQENTHWTLKAKTQWLLPEPASNIQQEDTDTQGPQQQKLVWQTECEWGSDRKQSIHIRIQGEQALSKQQRQQISSRYSGARRTYLQKQAAFLNKFDMVAEYKLQPIAQNNFNRLFELFKSCNYWNTDSHYQQSGRDGMVHATVIIDPISQQYANFSVKTPTQAVRIQSLQLPVKARPFPRVRQGDKSSHSAVQLLSRMAVGKGRAECSADGKRVRTFDGVLYKAPIGKCYSVLAKDCASQQPQFAVLIKQISKDSQDKKIKVITPEQTIVCQPQGKQLQCKVDGQVVDNDNQQQQGEQEWESDQVVEFNNEQRTDVTITVQGVQVRFGCVCSSCKCQKAWIKISHHYKQGQCGLCGHYDDQAEDELRMNDDQLTEDLAQFHRSYSVQDNEECSADEHNELYGQQNQQKFGRMDYDENNQRSTYRIKKSNKDYEQDTDEDSEWQAGGYQMDSSEEQPWARDQRYQQNQKKQPKQQQKGQQQQISQEQEDTQEPIELTKVLEYNHKICFSTQPVKQCPEGSSPVDDQDSEDYSTGGNNSNSQTNTKKMQFVCMSRSSTQARRLQRQARRGVKVDLPDQSPSFVESVAEPTRCMAY